MSNLNNFFNMFNDLLDYHNTANTAAFAPGTLGDVNVVAADLTGSPLEPFVNLLLNITGNTGGINIRRNTIPTNPPNPPAPPAPTIPANTPTHTTPTIPANPPTHTIPPTIPTIPQANTQLPNVPTNTIQTNHQQQQPANRNLEQFFNASWNNYLNPWTTNMLPHNYQYMNQPPTSYVMMDRYYFPTSMFTQYPQVQSLFYYPILGNTNQQTHQNTFHTDNRNLQNTRNEFVNNVNRETPNAPARRNVIAADIDTRITNMLRDAIQNEFVNNQDDEARPSRLTHQQITNKTSLDLAVNTMTPADSSTCAVCHGDFNPQHIVRRINYCRHLFHQGCIDIWLGDHNTCPVCRHDLSARSGNRDPIDNITTVANNAGRRIIINRTIRRRTLDLETNRHRNNSENEEDDDASETTTSDEEEQSESDDDDNTTHTHRIEAEIQIFREN